MSTSKLRGARCALGKRDGCAGCSRIAWPLDQRRRELTVTYAPGHSTRYDMRHWSRTADGAAPLLPYPVHPPNTLNLSIFHSLCHRSIAHVLHIPLLTPRSLPPLSEPTSGLANKVQRSLRAAIVSFVSRGGTFCNKAANSEISSSLREHASRNDDVSRNESDGIKRPIAGDWRVVVTYRNPKPCIVDLTCR